jgi:hypothetical protein
MSRLFAIAVSLSNVGNEPPKQCGQRAALAMWAMSLWRIWTVDPAIDDVHARKQRPSTYLTMESVCTHGCHHGACRATWMPSNGIHGVLMDYIDSSA